MSLYTDLLPEVMPFATDCPQNVAVNAIRNAAIEFCERSLYYTYEVPAVDTVSGTAKYSLVLPADTTLAHITDAWVDKRFLNHVGEDDLRQLYGNDWRTQNGFPAYVTQQDLSNVILVPNPITSVVGGLKLIAALKPTRASTTIDSGIKERWLEVIAAGALARVHAIPNMSFSDPQTAMLNRAIFSAGIARADVERRRGLVRTITSVRPPRFV